MIKEAYSAGYEAAFEKLAKLRGRSLRDVRTFLAKNKHFAGHATTDDAFKNVLEDGHLRSPSDIFLKKGLLPETGEQANNHKNIVKDIESKGLAGQERVGAIADRLPSTVSFYPNGLPVVYRPARPKANPPQKARYDPGFGHHGFLVPSEAPGANVMATAPYLREMRVTSPVPIDAGVNIAPRDTITKLRQEYRDKRFIDRDDLRRAYPDLFQNYAYAGNNRKK